MVGSARIIRANPNPTVGFAFRAASRAGVVGSHLVVGVGVDPPDGAARLDEKDAGHGELVVAVSRCRLQVDAEARVPGHVGVVELIDDSEGACRCERAVGVEGVAEVVLLAALHELRGLIGADGDHRKPESRELRLQLAQLAELRVAVGSPTAAVEDQQRPAGRAAAPRGRQALPRPSRQGIDGTRLPGANGSTAPAASYTRSPVSSAHAARSSSATALGIARKPRAFRIRTEAKLALAGTLRNTDEADDSAFCDLPAISALAEFSRSWCR